MRFEASCSSTLSMLGPSRPCASSPRVAANGLLLVQCQTLTRLPLAGAGIYWLTKHSAARGSSISTTRSTLSESQFRELLKLGFLDAVRTWGGVLDLRFGHGTLLMFRATVSIQLKGLLKWFPLRHVPRSGFTKGCAAGCRFLGATRLTTSKPVTKEVSHEIGGV